MQERRISDGATRRPVLEGDKAVKEMVETLLHQELDLDIVARVVEAYE